MGLKLTNNASSVLAGAIDTAAVSIALAAGDGSKFPVLAAGDWFPCTIVDGSGNIEIVRATARNGDILTVTRAQEGTAAAAFGANSRIDLRITVAVFNEFVAASNAALAANNLSDLADPAAARNNLGLGDAAEHAAADFATAAQGAKADSAVQPADMPNLAAVATSGDYTDLTNKPTTIANAQLVLDRGTNNIGNAGGLAFHYRPEGPAQPDYVFGTRNGGLDVWMYPTAGLTTAGSGGGGTTGAPLVLGSPLPVDYAGVVYYNDTGGGSLPDGSSVAGSLVALQTGSQPGATQTGTWKNISGNQTPGATGWIPLFMRRTA